MEYEHIIIIIIALWIYVAALSVYVLHVPHLSCRRLCPRPLLSKMSTQTVAPRVVVITGGAQGLGRAIALAFLRSNESFQVAVGDVNEEAGVNLAKYVAQSVSINDGRDASCRFYFSKLDVSSEESVISFVRKTLDHFHTSSIHVLVNNAAISNPWYTQMLPSPSTASASEEGKSQQPPPITQLPLAMWQSYMNVNLTGTFLMTKHVTPHMTSVEGGGSIINIASTRALMSEPHTEAYAASKGGLVSLTHALAVSLGKYSIRVNAISPGWIDTTGSPDAPTSAGLSVAEPPFVASPLPSSSSSSSSSTSSSPSSPTSTPTSLASTSAPAAAYGSSIRLEDHAQHAVGRVGVPQDIAEAVLFFADRSKSGFITGTNLVVDGGMTKTMIYAE